MKVRKSSYDVGFIVQQGDTQDVAILGNVDESPGLASWPSEGGAVFAWLHDDDSLWITSGEDATGLAAGWVETAPLDGLSLAGGLDGDTLSLTGSSASGSA